jgi:hypothetical protein
VPLADKQRFEHLATRIRRSNGFREAVPVQIDSNVALGFHVFSSLQPVTRLLQGSPSRASRRAKRGSFIPSPLVNDLDRVLLNEFL